MCNLFLIFVMSPSREGAGKRTKGNTKGKRYMKGKWAGRTILATGWLWADMKLAVRQDDHGFEEGKRSRPKLRLQATNYRVQKGNLWKNGLKFYLNSKL